MALDASVEEAINLVQTNAPYAPEELGLWRGLADALIASNEGADFLLFDAIWHGAERVLGQAHQMGDKGLEFEAHRLFEEAATVGSRLQIDDISDYTAELLDELAFRLIKLGAPDTDAILALRRLTYRLWLRDPGRPRARRLLILYAEDLSREGRAAESAAVWREIVADRRPDFAHVSDPDIALDILYDFYRASVAIVLSGDPLLARDLLVDAAALLDRIAVADVSLWRAKLCIALADTAIAIARTNGAGFSGSEATEFGWRESIEAADPVLIHPALVGLEQSESRYWINEQSRKSLKQASSYLSVAEKEIQESDEVAQILEFERISRRAEIELEINEVSKALRLVDFAAMPDEAAALLNVKRAPELAAVTTTALASANRFEDARQTAETYLKFIGPNLIIRNYGSVRAYLLLLQCECDVRLAGLRGQPIEGGAGERALERLFEAVAIDDEFLNANAAPLSDRLRFRCLAPVLRRLSRYLGIVLALSDVNQKGIDRFYEIVLRRKFRVTSETVALYRSAAEDPQAGDLMQRAKEARRTLAQHDVQEVADLGAFRERRRALADALDEAELYLSWVCQPHPINELTIRDIRDSIDNDTVLLDYVVVDPPGAPTRYGVFVVGHEKLRYVDLGETGGVDDAIRGLLEEIARPDPNTADLSPIHESARLVANYIVKPVLHDLREATSLLICPSGPWLGKVPFALLLIDQEAQLIDRFATRYAPSALFHVINGRDRHRSATAAIVLGDPDFGFLFPDGDSNQFEQGPLPSAHQEAAEIAALLGVEPIVGAAARKGAIETARSPRVLHLITHGFEPPKGRPPHFQQTTMMSFQHVVNGIPVEEASPFGPAVPYETPEEREDARADWLKQAAAPDVQAHQALILAGFYTWAKGLETPADVGNGLLTANEFASLDLCGTDLVVLSACGTGLGKLVSTESSVAGFRRTAFIAGSRSLVTSLWRVPDRPTTELMIRFYAHLAEGTDSASALRVACLDERKRYPHPKNWAGFICEGTASSLELG